MTITATRHLGHRDPYLLPDTADTYTNGIDWIAVERAANGQLPNPASALTSAERIEVWRLMLARGCTITAAATNTGSNNEAVRTWVTVENLRAHPGRWAVVKTTKTAKGAQDAASRIKNGTQPPFTPAGAFDAFAHKVGDEHQVHACYIGQPTKEAA